MATITISKFPKFVDKSVSRIYLKNRNGHWISTSDGKMFVARRKKKIKPGEEEEQKSERIERIIKPLQDFPERMIDTPEKIKKLWEKGKLTEYV